MDLQESKLTTLNWNRFWPNLLDLNAMDQLLAPTTNTSIKISNCHEALIAPIIAEIIVRLPWANLVGQYLSGYQPMEATRAFHSLLLSIFAKCIHRRETYSVSNLNLKSFE